MIFKKEHYKKYLKHKDLKILNHSKINKITYFKMKLFKIEFLVHESFIKDIDKEKLLDYLEYKLDIKENN